MSTGANKSSSLSPSKMGNNGQMIIDFNSAVINNFREKHLESIEC